MKKILIYGSGDFGKTVKHLVKAANFSFAGFIDDYNSGGEISGSFEEVIKSHPKEEFCISLAIGYKDLKARWEVYMKIRNAGYDCPAIIHPDALVDCTENVGDGSIIMAGAILNCNAIVKDAVVMWPGSNVNHDTIIDNNTFLSPGAIVCGFVNIGKNCFIGAGSVVVNNVTVPDDSFIKAGTVFTSR